MWWGRFIFQSVGFSSVYLNHLCLTLLLQVMEDVSEPKRNPFIRASSESSTDPACCPSVGDTLPWNLPKHQRMKRSKSASGEVLDPAERAVIRIAGMEAPALHLKQDFILRNCSCYLNFWGFFGLLTFPLRLYHHKHSKADLELHI